MTSPLPLTAEQMDPRPSLTSAELADWDRDLSEGRRRVCADLEDERDER